MKPALKVSIAINAILLVAIIFLIRDRGLISKESGEKIIAMQHEALQSTAYSQNYAAKLEVIQNVSDQSYSELRKAYDNSENEKISRQLALDSVYLVKQWIDKAVKETKDWPNRNRDEIQKVFSNP